MTSPLTLRLLKLHIQNFMRFGNVQQLALADAGLTSIEAENRDDDSVRSNGAGKSALVDALLWCFYGKTTHDPTAKGDEVVHEDVGQDCVVRCTFTRSGNTYAVTRGIKVKSAQRATWGLAKASDLVFECTHGDIRSLTKGSIKETQEAIVTVLGMTHGMFRHVVVFGQSKAFRFGSLNDTDRKAVLDEMLSVELYARAAQAAKLEARDAQTKLDKVEAKVEAVDTASDKKRLRLLKQDSEDFVSTRGYKVKALHKKVVEYTTTITELRDSIPKSPDLKAIAQECRDVVTLRDNVNSAISGEKHELAAHVRDIKSITDKLSVDLSGECGACGSTLTADEVKQHHSTLRKSRVYIEKSVEIRRSVIRGLEAKYAKHAKAIVKLDTKADKARDAKYNRVRIIDRADALADRRDDLKQELDELKVSTDPYTKHIKTLRSKLRKCKESLALLERRKEVLQNRIGVYQFWQLGFGAKGIRSLMLDSVLPTLNAYADTYSDKITDGNIRVEFRAQRTLKNDDLVEDFHIHVSNAHGSSLYKMNSIGERAKVDVIVGLAIQSTASEMSSARTNVVFFDEPFEGLDDVALDRVADMLTDVLRERESVFVITHEDSLKASMPHRVLVIKEGGFSVIEE